MLRPLEQWFCDTCGEVIGSFDEGFVEWLVDEDEMAHGFRIVHHAPHSPHYPNGSCYRYSREVGRADLPLSEFAGEKGMIRLLAYLDKGPHFQPEYKGLHVSDPREFVEFFRRLKLAYYEEARMYWDKAAADGWFIGDNPVSLYASLRRLVEEYGQDPED